MESLVSVERIKSFVAVWLFVLLCGQMELSSDEKCAIERDRFVKIVKEAGKTLPFKDYVVKFKSDLKQWKKNLRTPELF